MPIDGVCVQGYENAAVNLGSCASACRDEGVPWRSFVSDDASAGALMNDQRSGPLWVVSQRFPASARDAVVRGCMRHQGSSILVCPEQAKPMTRALLLNDARRPDGAFLQAAASLCRRLGVAPVILTVARSERLANHATTMSQAALAPHDFDLLFDCVVGLEARSAVGRIARWRRCQLVIMNQDARPAWWEWFRVPAFLELAEWLPDISFLSLSRGSVLGKYGYTVRDGAKVVK